MSVTKSTKETLQYMLDGIKYVCENFKRRGPGTESERNAQAFFKKELEKYADSVEMEDFNLHPHAFMGFIIIAGILSLIFCFYVLAVTLWNHLSNSRKHIYLGLYFNVCF